MLLSPYGKREWLLILAAGAAAIIFCLYFHWWIPAAIVLALTLALLSFFRDPHRTIPKDRGLMVSPADGVVSSVHQVDHFEPFGEPAACVRIFLSVLNVHVNRSPCHAQVISITHKPGKFMNALNPESAQVNEANMIVLVHPTTRRPIAAVNQIAGAIARRIVCGISVGQTVQRGDRIGLIKFGSTTELYLPLSSKPEIAVHKGQKVYGGSTILARVAPSAEVADSLSAPSPFPG